MAAADSIVVTQGGAYFHLSPFYPYNCTGAFCPTAKYGLGRFYLDGRLYDSVDQFMPPLGSGMIDKESNLHRATLAKFKQNEALLNSLLETGITRLVCNYSIGYGAVLMKVREELRAEQAKKKDVVVIDESPAPKNHQTITFDAKHHSWLSHFYPYTSAHTKTTFGGCMGSFELDGKKYESVNEAAFLSRGYESSDTWKTNGYTFVTNPDVLYRFTLAKFKQNPILHDKLLDTGESKLECVDGSRKYSEVVMRVRDKLREEKVIQLGRAKQKDAILPAGAIVFNRDGENRWMSPFYPFGRNGYYSGPDDGPGVGAFIVKGSEYSTINTYMRSLLGCYADDDCISGQDEGALYAATLAKFQQNSSLCAKLLSTIPHRLESACCVGYGPILMRVREELHKAASALPPLAAEVVPPSDEWKIPATNEELREDTALAIALDECPCEWRIDFAPKDFESHHANVPPSDKAHLHAHALLQAGGGRCCMCYEIYLQLGLRSASGQRICETCHSKEKGISASSAAAAAAAAEEAWKVPDTDEELREDKQLDHALIGCPFEYNWGDAPEEFKKHARACPSYDKPHQRAHALLKAGGGRCFDCRNLFVRLDLRNEVGFLSCHDCQEDASEKWKVPDTDEELRKDDELKKELARCQLQSRIDLNRAEFDQLDVGETEMHGDAHSHAHILLKAGGGNCNRCMEVYRRLEHRSKLGYRICSKCHAEGIAAASAGAAALEKAAAARRDWKLAATDEELRKDKVLDRELNRCPYDHRANFALIEFHDHDRTWKETDHDRAHVLLKAGGGRCTECLQLTVLLIHSDSGRHVCATCLDKEESKKKAGGNVRWEVAAPAAAAGAQVAEWKVPATDEELRKDEELDAELAMCPFNHKSNLASDEFKEHVRNTVDAAHQRAHALLKASGGRCDACHKLTRIMYYMGPSRYVCWGCSVSGALPAAADADGSGVSSDSDESERNAPVEKKKPPKRKADSSSSSSSSESEEEGGIELPATDAELRKWNGIYAELAHCPARPLQKVRPRNFNTHCNGKLMKPDHAHVHALLATQGGRCTQCGEPTLHLKRVAGGVVCGECDTRNKHGHPSSSSESEEENDSILPATDAALRRHDALDEKLDHCPHLPLQRVRPPQFATHCNGKLMDSIHQLVHALLIAQGGRCTECGELTLHLQRVAGDPMCNDCAGQRNGDTSSSSEDEKKEDKKKKQNKAPDLPMPNTNRELRQNEELRAAADHCNYSVLFKKPSSFPLCGKVATPAHRLFHSILNVGGGVCDLCGEPSLRVREYGAEDLCDDCFEVATGSSSSSEEEERRKRNKPRGHKKSAKALDLPDTNAELRRIKGLEAALLRCRFEFKHRTQPNKFAKHCRQKRSPVHELVHELLKAGGGKCDTCDEPSLRLHKNGSDRNCDGCADEVKEAKRLEMSKRKKPDSFSSSEEDSDGEEKHKKKKPKEESSSESDEERGRKEPAAAAGDPASESEEKQKKKKRRTSKCVTFKCLLCSCALEYTRDNLRAKNVFDAKFQVCNPCSALHLERAIAAKGQTTAMHTQTEFLITEAAK